MATFYVVGTPIGNLEDITLRALRILGEVDLILCEDTRVTRKLLERHNIKTQCESYHAHTTDSKMEKILDMIGGVGEDGINIPKNIALVSDAGTPGISDPGSYLVGQIRARFADEIARGGIKIESVPGPSAVTAALSVAGVECSQFTFLGFLPHKKGRETLFKEIVAMARPAVFYESPHRIMKTLESLAAHLQPEQNIVIVRELTKIYEEVVRGTPAEVTAYFEKNSEKIRGEFVVIVKIAG
jgi:16S rRNA (cytidine1402-2'-O)-methyltransferase